jgi:hypothetical protein
LAQKESVKIAVNRTEGEPDENHKYISFCTAKIIIPRDIGPKFYLKIKREAGEQGIILTPCDDFKEDTVEGISTARSLYDNEGKKTSWSVTFNHTCIEGSKPLEFEWPGSKDIDRSCVLEFGAQIINFQGIKFSYSLDDMEWEDIEPSGGSEPQSMKDCEKSRFEWVVRKIEQVNSHDEKKYPLFHIKQKATIIGFNEPKLTRIDSVLTYVGPDDVANLFSAVSNVASGDSTVSQINLRMHAKDSLSESKYLTDNLCQILELKDDDITMNDHHESWTKSDLIIDTYTAIAWEKSDDAVIDEIRKRLDSLKPDGQLILVFPINEEHFYPGSSTPEWLTKKIKRSRIGEIEGFIKLVNSHDLGNARVAILEKFDASKVKEEVLLSADQESYSDHETNNAPSNEDQFHTPFVTNSTSSASSSSSLSNPAIHTNPEIKNSPPHKKNNNSKSMPTRIKNWDQYVRACKKRNNESAPNRPYRLPIVEKMREYLEHIDSTRNVMMIHAHPGWGKTSLVGEALFPVDSGIEDINRIWFGSMDQLEYYIETVDPDEVVGATVILDDLHREKVNDSGESRTGEDVIGKIKKISSHVRALIITCRIDEWDGKLCQQLPEISEPFDNYIFPEWETHASQEFVKWLRKQARCDVPESHRMFDNSMIWTTTIHQKLFSLLNIKNKGADYSPRDAINYLRERKYDHDDESVDTNKHPDFDTDEFGAFKE